ncbi:putative glycine dehydrogenase (decarboxylating) subunit 2 [Thalassobaculum fulvum]|uniref:Probable glycine dehydrogenase (decarboxylating) subunit 2 n=1 Tax=Thalassobaculum fulvum TaxID=1633335 RepID=A0A918XUK1_9PROT|nr:aminomethyl-transferring glycine dehydrogenase subunit GcvPB [Thalassobaculum fulvum]GHD55586.1 putative glycine dehydrogenase (decarboxylating) subunit 2 [Thalassobaculum fulvum]
MTDIPTLYELSVPGRPGTSLPDCDVPPAPLPDDLVRADNGLPELSEPEVVRHYLHLSQRNYGVDGGFYPLGSCTMKYNPKINERLARLPGFAGLHPLQDEASAQGALELMHRLQEALKRIGGFAGMTLQPAAGAQGELTALLMIRAWHANRGEPGRDVILIPDSAHGTNPASATMAGFVAVEVPSDGRGNVDIEAVSAACDDRLAGIMLTNPTTLGLFEERIDEVAALVHAAGGLVYGDGANMNALTGIARPGDLGVDLMHFNLHKTFATPHGGGGPGSGPVGASAALAPYLPGPVVEMDGDGRYRLETPARSIGRMCAFHGNFGMLVRAYASIAGHGDSGLKANAMAAVLNANYLRVKLRDRYPVPFDRTCMHEFVCEGRPDGTRARALDVSKRLMDYGFHPPTNYFPLIVPEALMIEPTETETLATLDAFVAAMLAIADEARDRPDLLHDAPHTTPVRRLDEVRAARELRVAEPGDPE